MSDRVELKTDIGAWLLVHVSDDLGLDNRSPCDGFGDLQPLRSDSGKLLTLPKQKKKSDAAATKERIDIILFSTKSSMLKQWEPIRGSNTKLTEMNTLK